MNFKNQSLALGTLILAATVPAIGQFNSNALVSGWAEAQLYPSHNEVDLGRCPIGNSTCTAFGRYAVSGNFQIRFPQMRLAGMPFVNNVDHILSRVYLIAKPTMYFGNTTPQMHYTLSATPIMFTREYGVGVDLGRGFEVQLLHHDNQFLKSYATPGNTNGPGGLNSYISVRKYLSFGSVEGGRRH